MEAIAACRRNKALFVVYLFGKFIIYCMVSWCLKIQKPYLLTSVCGLLGTVMGSHTVYTMASMWCLESVL